MQPRQRSRWLAAASLACRAVQDLADQVDPARAASPSPRPTAGRSGRRAGRTRSARSRPPPSAARPRGRERLPAWCGRRRSRSSGPLPLAGSSIRSLQRTGRAPSGARDRTGPSRARIRSSAGHRAPQVDQLTHVVRARAAPPRCPRRRSFAARARFLPGQCARAGRARNAATAPARRVRAHAGVQHPRGRGAGHGRVEARGARRGVDGFQHAAQRRGPERDPDQGAALPAATGAGAARSRAPPRRL